MNRTELIEKIRDLSKQKCWDDYLLDGDDCVVDFAGSNVDDAYDGGFRSGEIMLARKIVECGLLDVNYWINL